MKRIKNLLANFVKDFSLYASDIFEVIDNLDKETI